MHCKRFSSTHDLYLQDAGSTLSLVTATEKVCRHCQMSLGVQNHPGLRTADVDYNPSAESIWQELLVPSESCGEDYGALQMVVNPQCLWRE